ncbi:transposase family protein [Streptomyces sp. NPDC055210]
METTHDVLACWFGVDRSTVTRSIGEVSPLLAQRGSAIPPDARLRTLAEVIEYLGVDGRTGIIDGMEIRVRRPAAGRKDRDKFNSGKTKQNAVKARGACCSAVRFGRAVVLTSPMPVSWAWSSSWPTARSWRSSRMPATRAWERRPAAGW